jgi:hypothetical protein
VPARPDRSGESVCIRIFNARLALIREPLLGDTTAL